MKCLENETRYDLIFARLRLPSLLQRGLPIITATLLSRPLGYVRVVIQARLFGATAAMDAFVLAFSIPSMLQVVLLSGPLSGVLVPTLSAYRHDRPAFNDVFNSVFTACLVVGVTLGGIAALAAPALMHAVGPGLAPETRALAILLFRIMLPVLVLQALLSVCKGGLNTLDSYGPPEYAGAVFNVVMIAAAVLLAPRFGVVSLALGASLGALMQLLMQFPYLARHGVVYRPRWQWNTTLRRMVGLAQGAFLSTMIVPVGSMIDRALASLLFPGAIASLNYAFLLFLLPASLCVVPLSTVLLTDLAQVYHQGDMVMLRRRALAALRLLLLLTAPVAAIAVVLADPVTRLVYEYGHFQAADTIRTAQAVRMYCIGLPFYGAMHVLTRCFYATQDTMSPALMGLGTLAVNVVGDWVLMQYFGHWGIALARTIALALTAAGLYVWFMHRCRRLQELQNVDRRC